MQRDDLAIIRSVDDALTKILGWNAPDLIGRRSLEIIHPEDRPLATTTWMEMLARPEIAQRTLVRYLHRDGSYVWFESTHDNRLADAEMKCVVSQMVDVSDRMDAIEKLRANEELLRRLTEALPIGIFQIDAERRIVHANERLGAVFMDLDRFKEINDRSGHAAGDEKLRRVGERLLHGVRAGDVVGRLGGDEFLIVCPDVASPQAALELARRISLSITERTIIGTQTVFPTASIGVAWTSSSLDTDAFVARADAAMYSSKRLASGPVLAA